MELNSKFFDMDFFNRLIDMLEQQLGKSSEIVLHDLRNGYEHTIADIRNGEITGRKIGGTGSNLGLEVLQGTTGHGDKYNYITKLPDGRYLRSSSLYIRDKEGEIMGCLCINTDITETLKFEQVLKDMNRCDLNSGSEDEIFVTDVNQLLECIIEKTRETIGKSPEEMTRDDKKEFVRILNDKGAFLITKSGERVQEYLGISKYTLYNYLGSGKNTK
ncbi:MAG: helix-turn-helix transcriptional regulator [Eubacteriales bacterium]|nr:helix-turn-helix transcriptional regulator [Eubacteriales bacterium]